MNRTQQLKLLNDEVRRLFSEGVSEQDAFERLQSDKRFDSIRRTSIQSLYKKFQKDVDKGAKKQQLEERKRMTKYRRNAKNSLIYEDLIFIDRDSSMCILQNRYYVTKKAGRQSNGMQVLNVCDLMQNVSKEISFQSANFRRQIYALSGNFIILIEPNNLSHFIRLAQINLTDGTLQFIQKLEFHRFFFLSVDSSDLSKFLILCESEDGISVVICKLVSDRIEIGDRIVLGNLNSYGAYKTYFNDQLLLFKDDWTEDMSDTSIIIQNLDAEKSKKTLKVKSFPSNIYVTDDIHAWSDDHFFTSIRFHLTDEYGITFTEPQTCNWTVLQFGISMFIAELLVINKFDLMVCSEDYNYETTHMSIYKLPMRKPEFLRNKAWTKLVMLFKKREADDPYEEARRYLPLNSDIRGPFAADEADIE